MAFYSAPLNATTMSTSATLGVVGAAGAARRGRIVDLVAGCDGTPGDTAVRFQFQRFTAAGTTTAVTPVPTDPADAACTAAAGQIATVEPTYTASQVVLQLVFNQRSTVRWFAAPGEEIVYPATAGNGVGCKPVVSPALSGWLQVMFSE